MVSTIENENTVPGHTCIMCGLCCRNFAYVQLTPDDVAVLKEFTGLTVDEFTYVSDEVKDDRFLQFQENGDCVFLKPRDGGYACSVYEARSAKCRGYPISDIQHQTCRTLSGR